MLDPSAAAVIFSTILSAAPDELHCRGMANKYSIIKARNHYQTDHNISCLNKKERRTTDNDEEDDPKQGSTKQHSQARKIYAGKKKKKSV